MLQGLPNVDGISTTNSHQPRVAGERDEAAVRTLREVGADARVLARRARRVRVQARELLAREVSRLQGRLVVFP